MNRIFCLGSGSSLSGFDWHRLDNENTIGTNRVMIAYPEVKELVFIDPAFYNQFHAEIVVYQGILWANRRAVPEGFTQKNMNIMDLSVNVCKGWIAGKLSGLTALEIACMKKPKEVFLLGYDLYPGHFYEVEDPLYTEKRVIISNVRFAQMGDKYPHVQIYNCNPISEIKVFPFRNLEDVL